MMRKHKKGFTIVELVIVVAVIAVLTAVLVPTFIHLSSKAKDSIDKTVVKNANIQLAAKQGLEGKNKSMSDAVKDVDEIGYHIPGVSTGNDNKIVWDSEADRFVLLNKDNEVLLKDSDSVAPHSKLFKAVSNLDDREDFAVYAKSDYSGSTSFTSAISFDAGDKDDVEAISYAFSDEAEVLVATNSQDTTLTVNCPNAEFKHGGLCGKEIMTAVKGDSFVDHGHVGYVQVDSGHYIADQGADIKAAYATSPSAKIDQQNGGKIGNPYGGSLDYTGENSKGNISLAFNDDPEAVAIQAVDDLNRDINPAPTPIGNPISNFAELKSAFEVGGQYYLVDDIPVTEYLRTQQTLTIDLNGHNINIGNSTKYAGCIIMIDATGKSLTFKDSLGTGGVYNLGSKDADATFGMFGGSDFIIEGGNYLSSDDALFGGVSGKDYSRFVIRGGTFNGFITELQGKIIRVEAPCTLRIHCDMLPLGWLDTKLEMSDDVQLISGSASLGNEDDTLIFTSK